MFFSAAKHWKYWVAPLFAIALLTLYLWRQTPGHDWYLGDCAMYLMHARDLAEGLPYAQTAYVPQPETFRIGPSTYPPGYPLLLAPLYALYGYDFLAFKTLTNALLALSTLLIYLYVRRSTGDVVAWLIMFAVGLSNFYFSVWNVLGSDAAFLTELFLVLLLQDVAEQRGDLDRRPVLWGVILWARGAWYTYTTRSLGSRFVYRTNPAGSVAKLASQGQFCEHGCTWAALMAAFVPPDFGLKPFLAQRLHLWSAVVCLVAKDMVESPDQMPGTVILHLDKLLQ